MDEIIVDAMGDEYMELLAKATGYLDEDDFNGLLETAEKLIVFAPDTVIGWNYKGNALVGLERLDEAIAAFTTQAELMDDDPDAWALIAAMNSEVGNKEKALEYIGKSIMLKPENVLYLHLKCLALSALDRVDEAKDVLSKALSIEPGNDDLQSTMQDLESGENED